VNIGVLTNECHCTQKSIALDSCTAAALKPMHTYIVRT